MTTASALISDLQVKVGDTAANFLTTALGLTWFDEAQKKIVEILQPLDRTATRSVAQYQEAFAVPSEVIMIEAVTSLQGIRRILKRVTPSEYNLQKSAVQNAIGYPQIWTEKDGYIYVWPQIGTASLTTTVNASTTAAATTVTMASTGNLRSNGRVTIDSEEIEYTNKTSTTIAGCTRGMGGTTAATHVSAATVTQMDLEFYYTRHAIALASTAAPEIKPIWHENLQLYVAYLYYMSEGNVSKAQVMKALWDEVIKEATYIAEREHMAGPLTVKDIDTQRLTTLYGPNL